MYLLFYFCFLFLCFIVCFMCLCLFCFSFIVWFMFDLLFVLFLFSVLLFCWFCCCFIFVLFVVLFVDLFLIYLLFYFCFIVCLFCVMWCFFLFCFVCFSLFRLLRGNQREPEGTKQTQTTRNPVHTRFLIQLVIRSLRSIATLKLKLLGKNRSDIYTKLIARWSPNGAQNEHF